MPDDELTELLRERRRRALCEAAGVPYIPDVLAQRSAPHCDPEEPTLPDVLLEANAPPPAELPPRELPLPLTVWSPAVTVTCNAGTGSATVAARESGFDLFLDDIDSITRSELYRIAPLRGALQSALEANLENLATGAADAATFDAAIMAAATVEAAAAAGIRVRALELRELLLQTTTTIALGRLVCVFSSAAVWVVCDSEQLSGHRVLTSAPSPLPDASLYRTFAAGAYTSTLDAEDATSRAVDAALADLTCVYFNTSQTVTCGPRAGSAAFVAAEFAHTYSPAFVWNSVPYSSLEALGAAGFAEHSLDALTEPNALVYAVTKVPSSQFAAGSQAAANALAVDAALQELNCFFPSRPRQIDCSSRTAVAARMVSAGMTRDQVFEEMDAEFDPGHPELLTNFGLLPVTGGVAIDTSDGMIVESPAGMVISRVSQELADAEAADHAAGFLSCFWLSPRVACSCTDKIEAPEFPTARDEDDPSFWFLESYLVTVKAPLSVTRSSAATVFEKGTLGASESGPVSDAMDLCKASLTCIFCNEVIPPRCSIAYDGATPGTTGVNLYESGGPLPLQLVTPFYGVSSNLTAGLPANSICEADPLLVFTLANATASTPPNVNNEESEPVCRYVNQEIVVNCIEKAGELEFGLTPSARARSLTISAGSFEAANQVTADANARSFGLSILSCEYGNPPLTLYCGATLPPVEAVTAGSYTDGIERPTTGPPDPPVHATAVGGGSTPVTVLAYASTSLESPYDATRKAFLAAFSRLNCFWMNVEQTFSDCPSGQTLSAGGAGVVAANVIRSWVSQADADGQALAMAQALVQCENPSDGAAIITSAFGVVGIPGGGGGGGGACCKSELKDDANTKLYSYDSGDGFAELHEVDLTAAIAALNASLDCASTFCLYLNVVVTHHPDNPLRSRWTTALDGTGVNFTADAGCAIPLTAGAAPAYTNAVRMVAKVTGSGDDCSAVMIFQLIRDAQKLSAGEGPDGAPMPLIVDYHTPIGGGEATTAGLSGAFCTQFEESGNTYLLAGTISGSNGSSEAVANELLYVTSATPPHTHAGERLYLVCNVTATLANGVVQPGVELNSAALTWSSTAPPAHTFSTSSLTGDVVREIGYMSDTVFLPSGPCGLHTVSGCPGSFAIH